MHTDRSNIFVHRISDNTKHIHMYDDNDGVAVFRIDQFTGAIRFRFTSITCATVYLKTCNVDIKTVMVLLLAYNFYYDY